MADNDFLEIAAIWRNESKTTGKEYFSGSLGKTKIFLFPVESTNPKAPAYRICLAPRQDDEKAAGAPSNYKQAEREQPRGNGTADFAGPPDNGGDQLPF